MKDLEKDIERLDLLYALGKHTDAIDASTLILESLLEYEGELEGDPYRTVLLKRGACFDALERFNEALEVYDFLIRADPVDVLAWRSRAHALMMLESGEEALDAYDRVLELEQYPDADTFMKRGMVLSGLGRHDEAVLSYDRCLELEPARVDVWEKRGDSSALAGRFEEARASYARALDIEPLMAGVWIKMAQTLSHDEDKHMVTDAYEKALEACDHLLRQEDDPDTWLLQAQALKGLGRNEDSIASVSKAAESYERMGLKDAALECRRDDEGLHEPAWHRARKGVFMEVPKPIKDMDEHELRELAIGMMMALKKKR